MSPSVFTVTSKLNVVSPVAGTFMLIPLSRLSWLYSVLASLFIFILSGTNVVPCGIASVTFTFFSRCPSFVTVIV